MKQINFKVKVRVWNYIFQTAKWKGKPTGGWIIYSKKYDISAYGRTLAKARKMFEVTLTEILLHSKPKKRPTSKKKC